MILLHPSSVGKIMANPPMAAVPRVRKSTRKPKTPEDAIALAAEHKAIDDDYQKRYAIAEAENQKQLSDGAKTYCKQLAKEFVYGFKTSVSSRYLDKGNMCEDEAIELYNDVFFTSHKKNTERKKNEILTGEIDILANNKIIDIKNAWSLSTFPAFKEDAHNSDYEWQGRSYMMLWDVDLFEVAYCMVTTPPELMGWEIEEIHCVDHIDPQLRITRVQYERDEEKEKLIDIKCRAAQEYINQAIQMIAEQH